MGAGAVGCYYGGMLARAGAPVTLIGRAVHVDAVRRSGLRFDGLRVQESIPIDAAEDPAAAADAKLVLFCVKSTDTESAARALAPRLAPDAVVLSLQNGVDNAARIRLLVRNAVVPAVVYVATEMAGPGHLRHTGRGDLVIGTEGAAAGGVAPRARLDALAATLERADIPTRVSDNVEGELWAKLLLNCAYNAISALCRACYRSLADHPAVREVMRAAVGEVVLVARASGVRLPPGDHIEIALKLADSMPTQRSSTAQDIARGRPTEIDHLNGFIVRRGDALGVPVPVNRTLHALVKLLEEAEDPPGLSSARAYRA
jgi:2-dehydropantoate 2-reductase